MPIRWSRPYAVAAASALTSSAMLWSIDSDLASAAAALDVGFRAARS